jgi:predicted flap endonuclease-1-like 5' DNA nuclease
VEQHEQSDGVYSGASDEALQARILQLEEENHALKDQLDGDDADGVKVQALLQQVEYLKTRNEQLQQELDSIKSSDPTNDSSRVQALQEQVSYLKNQNADLTERLAQPKYSAGVEGPSVTKDRLADFEARLNQLESENLNLKASIDQLNHGGIPLQDKSAALESDDQSSDQPEPDTDLIMQPKTDLFKTDRELLMDQSRDDLSRIEGVGPFIEKKLNDIGVYSFEQIANWTESDIASITQQLNYFEGRIVKDNWTGQAQELKDAPAEPEKGTGSLEETDELNENLTVIEGIGPKIEAILKNAGIMTLEQLAQADPADIELILEQADPRYQMHDPATWPAQARLAANGNWDVLEDYQEKLKGGRDID